MNFVSGLIIGFPVGGLVAGIIKHNLENKIRNERDKYKKDKEGIEKAARKVITTYNELSRNKKNTKVLENIEKPINELKSRVVG